MSHPKKLSLWQKIKQFLTLPIGEAASEKSSEAVAPPNLDNDLRARMAATNSSKASPAADSDPSAASPSQSESATQKDNRLGQSQARFTFKQLDKGTNLDHAGQSTPITDRFSDYLTQQHWHYTHHKPKPTDNQLTHHLSLRMKHDHVSWVCLFRIQERTQLVAVYGILPFFIPESHRSAAMLLTTQLNYDMVLGNIEMDLSDGEIRYKASLDIEATGITDEIISYLIQSVIAMTTVSYELFSDLLDNPTPAQDIDLLLDQIRQQVEARTYFLASEQVQ